MDEYLHVKEVAKLLAVSEQTIRKLIKDGMLHSVRIGKRGVRVSRISIEEYINRNEGKNPGKTSAHKTDPSSSAANK